MKLFSILLLAGSLTLVAETKEEINKRFPVEPGGKVIVDVDFGSITVTTNSSNEVIVDVLRKVSHRNQSDEEAFLKDRPVTFSQEGNTVTIQSRGRSKTNWSWSGRQRTEGKYTLSLPAQFNAQLKTSGGAIAVSDLKGEVKAATSGGSLKFARLRGPLDGGTSGGSIHIAECEGTQKVKTSGGSIEVASGSGTLTGDTSGGSITVKQFRGPMQVETSGGNIDLENVAGKVDGSTSGGSISASFSVLITEEVKLETSAGSVKVRVPENSAFNLDASTSAGSVTSDLPVSTTGKSARDRLKGTVNGGGKQVLLRTHGGNIHLKRSKI